MAQLARFVASGVLVTVIALVVYAVAALALDWHPQLANFLACAIGLVSGYVLHSRWSFRGHGGDRTHGTRLRFLGVGMAAYGLNILWVWLLYTKLGLGPAAPMLPMALVTPAVTFLLNRQWVFR